MASVTSLGLQVPAGLEVLIAEGALPLNPSPNQYVWSNYNDDHDVLGEEEVVTTSTCVVWSQGGVVRRIFRFMHEDERVVQALLTWFPANTQDFDELKDVLPTGIAAEAIGETFRSEPIKRTMKQDRKARALVVLLNRQAHVYFLNGSNYIVSLPFLVEQAFATPEGLLIERKMSGVDTQVSSPDQPKAPSNSFWFSQQASIDLLNSPSRNGGRKSSIHTTLPSTLKDFVIDPQESFVNNMPRLYILTDPLAPIGLVVEGSSSSSDQQCRIPLDNNEELLYVSTASDSYRSSSPATTFFIVTANPVKRSLTVWLVNSIDPKQSSNDHPLHSINTPKARARRSSSIGHFAGSEVSTPKLRNVSGATASFSASFSGAVPVPPSHTKPPRLSEVTLLDGGLDALSQEELRNNGRLPGHVKESNRRTSSILARAELHSADHASLKDVAVHSAGTSQNVGSSFRARQSFGTVGGVQSQGRLRMSVLASTSDSFSFLNTQDSRTQHDGAHDIWPDLSCEDDHELLANMQRRAVLTKLTSTAMESSASIHTQASTPMRERFSVFALGGAARQSDPTGVHQSLTVCIHDKTSQVMLDTVLIISKPAYKSVSGHHVRHDIRPLSRELEWCKTTEVISAIRVQDGSESSVAVLHTSDEGPHLSLVNDWYCNRRKRRERTSLIALAKTHQLLQLHCPNSVNIVNSESVETPMPPRGSAKLAHSGMFGQFNVLDKKGNEFRIQARLRPQSDFVNKILSGLRLLVSNICHDTVDVMTIWRKSHGLCKMSQGDIQWQALVLTLFYFTIGRSYEEAQSDRVANGTKSNNTDSQLVTSVHQIPVWKAMRKRLNRIGGEMTDPNSQTEKDFIDDCVRSAHIYQISLHQDQTHRLSERPQMLSAVHLLLHVLKEEASLNNPSLHEYTARLNPVLARISRWLGRNEPMSQFYIAHSVPWFVLDWIEKCHVRNEAYEFAPLKELQSRGWIDIAEADNKNTISEFELAPRISAITKVLRAVHQSRANPSTSVSVMVENKIDLRVLETLPESISISLRKFILESRSHPPTTWPKKALDLTGRQDLSMLLSSTYDFDNGKMDAMEATKPINDTHTICQHAAKPSALFEAKTMPGATPMLLIFREDKRASEAQKLLNPLRVAIAEIKPREGCSEADFLEDQRRLAQLVYKRTMAIPAGQAVMEFCSYQPLLTENITVPSFNTSCNMQPSNTTVNADRSNFTEEKVCWAFFHAGVNAGLRIVRDAPGIDTSWLVLNKPNDLGNRHAGFLLALGLNGHLKSIAKWLAFKYLTPKHSMTSIGLLLGLSASHIGTMNSLVTRLLSVHITCLLPLGAAELNLSPLTQVAAVMGIGLLYCDSQHRRVTEVLLSEIEHVDVEDPTEPPDAFKNEGYRLAAGFALGMINLGTGNDLQHLHDLRITERLLAVATGPREIEIVQVLDQATPGAVIATALIFLKTGNVSVAKKIDIPTTPQQYDYVRADILLLRVVAKNLIMWDDIQPSLEWVRINTPAIYRSTTPESTLRRMIGHRPFNSKKLPFYNILGGLCWSISLRFSGTGNVAARDVCLFYLDAFNKLLEIPCTTYDELLTRNALLRFVHLFTLCAAAIMAGTGDVVTFRRLRAMHAALHQDITFGFHQATHMAIGILFLGQGRYSLSTSNLSIASLLCAFYPIFPQDVLDNRAHLQAFRHFWVFATEARCIMPKDAETGERIVTPVKIILRDGNTIDTIHNDGLRPPHHQPFRRQLMAPCLLPQLDTIAQVITTSDEYWQVTLDFAKNAQHLKRFRKDQAVYLRRKSVAEQHESTFDATLALAADVLSDEREEKSKGEGNAFHWTFDLPIFRTLGVSKADALGVFPNPFADEEGSAESLAGLPLSTLMNTRTTNIDDLLVLAESRTDDGAAGSKTELDALFKWSNAEREGGSKASWIRDEMVEALKGRAVVRGDREDVK